MLHNSFNRWDLFQYKGELIEDMPMEQAFNLGMATWARWISNNVNPSSSLGAHNLRSTKHNGASTRPDPTQTKNKNTTYQSFPSHSSKLSIERLIEEMSKDTRVVKYLNITKLSPYRRDAYPSVYKSMQWKNGLKKVNLRAFTDCIHWCLLGVLCVTFGIGCCM
ncbi:hypothetical protein Cgig2_026789 [Carnegiea gigantea]|uniref:Trichome birefringence-like C-terminal domain-containing protein n=1 Tax=Carnegiea gigantea TaxID=171969 RepID=A0A9Q1GMC6_9CARY|nr:hypothetical protein Cgig2_026789 [Carnegiea gigantea]